MQVLDADNAETLQLAMESASLSARDDIDGIPAIVTIENRQEFVNLYVQHQTVIKKKSYLDQLILGLNHYGVSICAMKVVIFP